LQQACSLQQASIEVGQSGHCPLAQSLDDHCARASTAITDGSEPKGAPVRPEHGEERADDARAARADGVAHGDAAAKGIDAVHARLHARRRFKCAEDVRGRSIAGALHFCCAGSTAHRLPGSPQDRASQRWQARRLRRPRLPRGSQCRRGRAQRAARVGKGCVEKGESR
jgi:hypothetical protein